MGCINKNHTEFIKAAAEFSSLSEKTVEDIAGLYMLKYRTDSFPPLEKAIYHKEKGVELQDLLSPFQHKPYLDKISKATGENYSNRLVELTRMYTEFRKTQEDDTAIMTDEDIINFAKYLVDKPSTYLDEALKDLANSVGETTANKFKKTLSNNFMLTNTFGIDIRTKEGVEAVREIERTKDIVILDHYNLPKLYDSNLGSFYLNLSGEKSFLDPSVTSLMKPQFSDSVINFVLSNYFLANVNMPVKDYFRDEVKRVLVEGTRDKVSAIEKQVKEDLLAENPSLKTNGSELAELVEEALEENEEYIELDQLVSIADLLESNEDAWELLESRLGTILKDYKFEMNPEIEQTTDEDNNLVESEEDDKITNEITIGEQYDKRMDYVNPLYGINPLVQRLFIGIPVIEGDAYVYNEAIPEIYLYENPRNIESKVLNILANSHRVTTTVNIPLSAMSSVEVTDFFEVMVDKLYNYNQENNDYTIGEVLSKIDDMRNKAEEDDSSMELFEDFKKEFVSSFSLNTKNYSVSIVDVVHPETNTSDSFKDYSKSKIRLTMSNFDTLSDLRSEMLSSIVSSLPASSLIEDKRGRKLFDMSNLDVAASHIIKYHSSKSAERIDIATIKKSLDNVLGLGLTDYELELIVNESLTVLPSKAIGYDGSSHQANVKISKLLDDYMLSSDPETKKLLSEYLTKKNTNNNLFGTIVNVLNDSRRKEQHNTFVLGSKNLYGYSGTSFLNLVLGDIKEGTSEGILKGFKGTHNALYEYFNALDKGSSDNVFLQSENNKTKSKRSREITMLDDTAMKEEDEQVVSTTDSSVLDKLVVNYLRFTNSENSYYSSKDNESNPYNTDIYHLPIAADGNMSIVFTGIDRDDNGTLLKTNKYFRIDADGTIQTNEVLMRAYSKKKLSQVLERMRRAEVLIEDYVGIDNLSKEEIDSKLVEANLSLPVEMPLEDKRNALRQDYHLRNLDRGYHYSTNKNLDDPKVKLEYKDFLGGTYHRGGHLNDILRESTQEFFSSLDNKELVDSEPYMLYKDVRLKATASIKYPQMSQSLHSLLPVLETDTSAVSNTDVINENELFLELHELIKSEILNVVDSEYGKIKDIVVANDTKGNEFRLGEIALDTMRGIDKTEGLDRLTMVETGWKNYIFNTIIYNTEFTDMFNGGFDKYKQPKVKVSKDGVVDYSSIILDTVDYGKRSPSPMKELDRMVNNFSNEPEIRDVISYNGTVTSVNRNAFTTLAIVKDAEVQSKYINDIKKATKLSSYISNIADAQTFASPAFYKKWVTSIKNGWTSHDEAMYNKLMDPNYKIDKEVKEWLKITGNFLAGTEKPFGYGLLDNKYNYKEGDDAFFNNTPLMLKTSFYFLFPALMLGTRGNEILKAMEGQGVDLVSFESAIKANSVTPTSMVSVNQFNEYEDIMDYNEDPFSYSPGKFRLNPFIVPNDFIGRQQDTPNKGAYEGDAPKQAMKNILANLDISSEEKNYTYKGKNYTAKEMFDKVTNMGNTIINKQIDKFKRDMYTDKYGMYSDKLNDVKIRNLVITQLDPVKDMDNIKLLRDPNVPIATMISSTQWILPIITKKIDKQVAQVNTNKGSVVQVADIGLSNVTDIDKTEILQVGDSLELAPPIPVKFSMLSESDRNLLQSTSETTIEPDSTIYFNEEGIPSLDPESGKMRISKAKMLMPFKDLNIGISWEQFKLLMANGKVDKEIFRNILAYRIPNQAISSNDSIEIVGILPPYHSDSAIVYHDITNKTGSDFDIDKLYLMLPSYKINRKNVLTGESKEQIALLKKEGIENKSIASFMQYTNFTGTSILSQLSEIPELNTLFLSKGLINREGVILTERPFYDIILNLDEIQEATENTSESLEDSNGNIYDAFEVIEDIEDAYLAKVRFNIEQLESRDTKVDEALATLAREEITTSIDMATGDNTKGNQNDFIQLYLSILESATTYTDLITPLDSNSVLGEDYYKNSVIKKTLFDRFVYKETGKLPNKLNEEELTKVRESYDKSTRLRVLQQFSPITRHKVKDDMDKAKNLVAVMANHMSDVPYTQLFKQKMKYSFLNFTNEYDKSKVLEGLFDKTIKIGTKDTKLSDINQTMLVSWLMNAAVDAAKDNYIIEGNFNTYTAPAAMFMTRVGLSPLQVFSILTSDAVQKITDDNTNNKSIIANVKVNESKADLLLDEANRLLSYLADSNKTFHDLFTSESILKEDKVLAENYTMGDALRGLWGIVNPIGKAMSNAIKLGKPDSEGTGSSYGKMVAKKNILKVVQEEDAFHGTIDKLVGFSDVSQSEKYQMLDDFQDEHLDRFTVLGSTFNAQNLGRKILGDFTLEGSKGYINLINDLSAALGETLTTKEDRIAELNNAVYSYIVAKVLDPFKYRGIGSNMVRSNDNLSVIKESLYNNIKKYKEYYKNSANGSFFRNILLDDTNSKITLGTMNINDTSINTYKAELGLLEEINPYITQDILMYSLLDNGLRPTKDSVYKAIPNSTSVIMGLGNKLEAVRQALSNGDYSTSFTINGVNESISISDIVKYIAMRNPKNYRFVKPVYSNIFTDSKNTAFVHEPTYTSRGLATFELLKGKDKFKTGNNVRFDITNPEFKDKLTTFNGKPALVINFYNRGTKKSYLGYLTDHFQSDENTNGREMLVYTLEEYDTFNTKVRVSQVVKPLHVENNIAPYSSDYTKLRDMQLGKESTKEIEAEVNIFETKPNSNENIYNFVLEDASTISKEQLIAKLVEQNMLEDLANELDVTVNDLISNELITPEVIKKKIECK